MFVCIILYCLIACWERSGPLVLLCVMLLCAFVIFPYGALGKVWYLTVLFPDLYINPYQRFFYTKDILQSLL